MTRVAEEVSDLPALLAHMETLVDEFGTEVWWRGQSNADWRLVPGAYRGTKSLGYERNIALRFMRAAPTRYARSPARSDKSAWIQLMQHYRLPTRLLDWSQSLLISLYFALLDDHDKPAALWALSPVKLNIAETGENAIFNTEDPRVQSLIAPAFDGKADRAPKILATFGEEVDLRMALQLSAFTMHGTLAPLDEHGQAPSFLRKFIVPANAKARLRNYLWHLGIRRSNLFPDLDNLALELAVLDFDEPEA